MKNIAIIIGSLRGGGAERIAGLLAKKLSTAYNVYLFLYNTADIIYDYGGTIVDLSINGSEYTEYYMAVYKQKYKIDCSISFLESCNFPNIRTRGEEKVIISERCTPSLCSSPNDLEGIKRLYNYADQIVAVSQGVKYDLTENFGMDNNLITTIYNFIDKDGIYKKMNEKIDPNILKFIGDSEVILNVGRLHDQKNQKKILVQFSKLIHEGENLKLIIAGAGEEQKNLEDCIENLELSDRVKIIPYGKNPFPYYKLASLFVLSSKYEGLPNVLLEAMACGVPIVAVDCFSGPRELLKDDYNYEDNVRGYEACKRGILVEDAVSDESGETEYLKEAMQMLLHTENIKKQVVDNGKKYIKEYSNDRILEEWINVIERTQKRKLKLPKEPEINIVKSKNIIIYGAGKIARSVVFPYLDIKEEYNLLCFAVSDLEENKKEVLGLPVYEIKDLVKYKETATVLMGVSRKYHAEVRNTLNKYGFKNVIYPVYKNLNYKHYWELDPDEYETSLSQWYIQHTGAKLDWNNLRTYNEKLQWLKLYDQTESKRSLSDKFNVRDFVREKIGEEYLVPLIGCWESFDEIDFEELPSEFMLKCTHGRGWNIAVHNKENVDLLKMKEQFDGWMLLDYAFCSGFELNYKGLHPKIIAEQMLHSINGEALKEYSVFVFDGSAKVIQVNIDDNELSKRNLYSRDWSYLPYGIGYPRVDNVKIKKPECLDKLIILSETLGANFRHIWIDFYVIGAKIYFGGVAFAHGSGIEQFTSQEFALEMGSWIKL